MQPRDKQCDLKRAHISGGTAAHVTGVLFSRSVHQFPFGCSTPDQAWPFRHVPVPASAEPLEQRTRHLRLHFTDDELGVLFGLHKLHQTGALRLVRRV